ncbi:MAG: gamma-carboxygeranoyl-CoA hydratase, partial [Agitococcus sp.]|nr:gamma-carboxygeranoyl-CoA hydratase [Agitococcus sp.]
ASFCLSEVKLGLVPAVISPYVIAAIGARQAQRYFLSAERFDAQTAYQLGLVQQLCSAEDLETQTMALINTILSNAPLALTACKQLIQQVHTSITPELRDYTTHLIAQLRVSPEGQEGLAAFLEKRPAGWLK